MADAQIGNSLGLLDKSTSQTNRLANVTADHVTTNIVVVDDASKLFVGQVVDIVNEATDVVLADDRTITKIEDNGGDLEVTYSGADAAATTDHALYPKDGYGLGAQEGFSDSDLVTIGAMRRRLKVIDATLYTDAYLNGMTYNDMVYAIRQNDHVGTI